MRESGTAVTTTPEAWVAAAAESFAAAEAALPVSERRVRVAGEVVLLRSAGPLPGERLSRAFAHLVDRSDGEPALTVMLWDSATSGARALSPSRRDEDPRGAVYYLKGDSAHAAFQPALALTNVYDAGARQAWFWCGDAAELPYWERAAPLRQILHWWLSEHQVLLLHGAAVGTESGGVLLVGPGGSGKSTTALSCLPSELLYAADDYVAVRDGAEPAVISLYSSGKVGPDQLELLPHLDADELGRDLNEAEKAVLYVHERFPARTTQGFPLRAVLVPRVAESGPRVLPAGGGAALRALAPSTLLQLHPPQPDAFARMRSLLRRLPTYTFEVGPDVDSIPGAIRAILEQS